MISEIEKRFIELLHKPFKSKEEIEELDLVREKFISELNNETRELLDQLNAIGLSVTSVWDLVNTKNPYPAAIDILVDHLQKKYHNKNKEGIIRALAVKEARGKANTFLIEEFYKTPKEDKLLRWVIGNTFYSLITNEDLEKVLAIIQDSTNGESREMFVLALGKIKSPKSEDALIELLDDNEMAEFALIALGSFKSKKW